MTTAMRVATKPPTAIAILSIVGGDRALQLRGADDETKWGVGDLALAECRNREGKTVNDYPITKNDIYRAIGDLVGLTTATVRARAETVKFWPRADRKQFDILPYSYFRAAMYSGSLDKARYWLAIVLDSADDYGGYHMPLRVLQAKIADSLGKIPANDIEPATPSLSEILSGEVDRLSGFIARPDMPSIIRLALGTAKAAIEQAIKSLADI